MLEKFKELGLDEELAGKVLTLVENGLKEKAAEFEAALGEKNEELAAALSEKAEAEKAMGEKAAELDKVRLEAAVEIGLMKAGGRNMRVLKALINREELSLNEGVVGGLDEQIEALKADEEVGFLFAGGRPRLAGEAVPEEGADFREGLSYEQFCEMGE